MKNVFFAKKRSAGYLQKKIMILMAKWADFWYI